MSKTSRLPCRHAALIIAVAIIVCNAALAEDERPIPRVPLLKLYQQECSACHVAYPPGMLPSASWKRLMNSLPRHFGTDASLDPAQITQLSTWLNANAGSGRGRAIEPPDDRITRSPWFVNTHDEISASTWKRPAVGSASNCLACHAAADKGDFNEHKVRIPR